MSKPRADTLIKIATTMASLQAEIDDLQRQRIEFLVTNGQQAVQLQRRKDRLMEKWRASTR